MKRSLLVVIAGILLLGACSDPAGGPRSNADPSTDTTSTSQTQEPGDATAETTRVAEAAAPTATTLAQEPTAPAGSDCIVGIWELDVATFETALQGIVDVPAETTLEGYLAVQFTPTGEYTQFKDAFTILTTVGGQTVRSVTTGALTGSYLLEEDVVHLFDALDIYHESYLEMPGVGRVDVASGADAEFDVFGQQYTAPSDANFGTYNGAGKFTCTSTGLSIDVDGKSVDWVPGTVPDMTDWK